MTTIIMLSIISGMLGILNWWFVGYELVKNRALYSFGLLNAIGFTVIFICLI